MTLKNVSRPRHPSDATFPQALVNTLNRVNAAHGSLIETLEREELCAFLHDVVRATGLDVPRGTDLTEEWREW